ncbi:glucan biosynthesis protein [Novosphingobium sp. 9]|uniref:glucan biosynthesis protein n=1 Tax=Novosphingobium sp. 9 TaxID=2025349 RepID=UPI0021B54664|nr:glucan biosynthesis protein [Novosphingobium sp. 9]
MLAALAATFGLPRQVLAATSPQVHLGAPQPFSWDVLVAMARKLAAAPYVAPKPTPNAAPDYDSAVKATYGPAKTLAGNVRLFPAAKINAPFPVEIALVKDGQARRVVDTTGLFVGSAHSDAAGFRVMTPDGKSDWLAYMGASYFRASGSRDQYGLSARGIAIDTGSNHGEEFPNFTKFWFEETGADRVRVHALMEGPSLTGAYAFDCAKTDAGVVQDIRATLFLRKDVEQLGLAAASSMFWYDQADPHKRPDWRPEIHDSDGLAIWSGNGERVWRPLQDPAGAKMFSFRADHPKGFGLLQRDQHFDHYEDDGVFYDKRPSLWVEPQGDWGAGAVYLYEMPTKSETLDNIAVFWRGDAPARAGERRDFGYRLTWTSNDPTIDANARCINSFLGPAGIPGHEYIADGLKFVYDFAGPSLKGLTRESGVKLVSSVPQAALIAAEAYPIVGTDDMWRAMIDLKPAGLPAPDFRLFLQHEGTALTETVIQAIEP